MAAGIEPLLKFEERNETNPLSIAKRLAVVKVASVSRVGFHTSSKMGKSTSKAIFLGFANTWYSYESPSVQLNVLDIVTLSHLRTSEESESPLLVHRTSVLPIEGSQFVNDPESRAQKTLHFSWEAQ